ncbi:hypothetical protein [Streptomyces sp. NPDC101150]|uniref:hypothetical protein n=1 Tax=Streptomyces sp. NPDC101150 TaxID=3366114 RepID=UPI0037F8D68C
MASVTLWDLAEAARAKAHEWAAANRPPGVVQELMLCLGECPDGPTKNMDEVTEWKIVFNDFPAPTDDLEEAELWSYEVDGRTDTGQLGDVDVHDEEFLGNSAIHGTITMTPPEAYKILCEYRQEEEAFQWVSLRLPPSSGHVGYNFLYDPLGHHGWAVNVDNRKVVKW